MFKCFTRNWYRANPSWPDGREPDATGRKYTVALVDTEEEAIAICQDWNATHKPGKLSKKCEFMECNK